MQAAFDHGADVVEFDVHRTADDRFAVFHDWTIDCRTEYDGESFSKGFDDPARVVEFPATYSGGVWTDRVDLIGPAVRSRW